MNTEGKITKSSNTIPNIYIYIYKTIGAAEWLVTVFAAMILTYLTILVLLFQANAENSILTYANVFLHLAVAGVIFGICFLLQYFLKPYEKIRKLLSILMPASVLTAVGIVSVQYVLQTQQLPSSDSMACYKLALTFSQGDLSAVVPKDSYLSLWPFQTGFIFILEKLIRIFHVTSPSFFQLMNCGYVLLLIAAGYGIVCMLTKNIGARFLYLFLMGTYEPLLLRVAVVYGDVPAAALEMLSCFAFLLYHKTERRWVKPVSGAVFFGAMVLASVYKRNSMIFVTAFVLLTLVQQLKKRDIRWLVTVLLTAFVCSQSTGITQKYYEYYAKNICGEGMPAIAYLAMGLQYNGEEAIPGGWNGFHSNTYIETGYSREKTVEKSRESIRSSLREFREDPAFALYFFHTKIYRQWANQTHGIYWELNALYDTGRDPEAYWVRYLEGKKYDGHLSYEDVHESVVYLILFGSVLLLLWKKKKGQCICPEELLPFVTLIGGFLFSLIWEGQTRAVYYYPILLLPVAVGIVFRQRESQGKAPTDKISQ